jgi:hypothetical protein
VQEYLGQQPMTPFRLRFDAGQVSGDGKDVVGRFTFAGEYDAKTGRIILVKQYLGKHRVLYEGGPDGEGCIQGTWSIGQFHTGPFRMRPAARKVSGEEPIQEIV